MKSAIPLCLFVFNMLMTFGLFSKKLSYCIYNNGVGHAYDHPKRKTQSPQTNI